jgi:hypothetical protein
MGPVGECLHLRASEARPFHGNTAVALMIPGLVQAGQRTGFGAASGAAGTSL